MLVTFFVSTLVVSVLAVFAAMAILPVMVESEMRDSVKKPENLMVFEEYQRMRHADPDVHTPDAA